MARKELGIAPAGSTDTARFGDIPVSANLSGSVGLSAANGTAATWTRSDATHALDVSIGPTWTGAHIFTQGVQLGSPTGGNKGAGTLNVASGIYLNGAALSAALTATQIGYGSSGGQLTGTSDFTWNTTSQIITMGTTVLGPTIQGLAGSPATTMSILGGATTTGSSTAQTITITAGANTGTGNGGNVNLNGGSSSSLNGGNVNITSGGGANVSGNISITGGTATNNNAAGNITITGSPATGTTSVGNIPGAVTITAGRNNNTATTFVGVTAPSVTISGGSSAGGPKNNIGGNVVLQGGYTDTGTPDATFVGGSVLIRTGSGSLTTRLTIDYLGASKFQGTLGCNNVTPPAQVTGWGTPTGASVVANFNGASATLVNCSNAIAKILTDLKGFGLYAA